MAYLEGWQYPSGGGNWGIRADYTWNSSTRYFSFPAYTSSSSPFHGYRSNYLSQGNCTMGLKIVDNFGNVLWDKTCYITMSFAKAAWSTKYWQHDYYPGYNGQTLYIQPNVSSVHVYVYTTSDAFNSYIKSKTWDLGTVSTNPVYYNVAYNANGGSSTPATQSVIWGGSATLAAAISRTATVTNPTGTITISYNTNGGSTAPTASTGTYTNTKTVSYTFEKWHLNSTSGTAYAAKATYSNVKAAATFYAGWTSSTSEVRTTNPSITLTSTTPTKSSTTVSSYDVSYNANGGTSTPTKQTATKTRAYTFSKWNSNDAGTGTDYTGGAAYEFSANATLYAKYTTSDSGGSVTLASAISKNNTDANVTISVSYDANGGTGAPSAASTGTAVNTTPYTFNKWADGSATGTQYAAGASFTPSVATTMYATWTTGTTTRKSNPSITLSNTKPTKANTTVSSYDVTFNVNGSGGTAPAKQTATKTRSYTFSKWNTKSDGSGTDYNANTAYTFSANTTLYAKYTTSDSGGSITLPAAISWTGRTFKGWNTKSDGTGTNYNAGASYTPTAATTLYAKWELNTYTIAYDANGGTGAPSSQTKTYGTDLTLSSTKPTKSNTTATGYTVTFNGNGGTASKASQAATDTTSYTFSKWTTAKDGTGTSYNSGATYSANAAVTLYAQYTSSTTKGAVTTATATKSNGTSTRTVTYNANGGTCSTTSANSTATVTYSCSGWFTATSGGTKRATSGGSYTPTASETVYAQYTSTTGTFSELTLPSATKANGTSTRTVTFNANGGSCSTASLNSTATVTYSQTGWFTAASGGTSRGAAGAKYTPSATETVYAQFSSSTGTYSAITLPSATKANGSATCTVTYDANGGSCSTTSATSTATITYTQTGWWTATSGGTNRGKSGATYTPSAAETVYAQFSSSQGAYSAVTLPTPTRDNYIFKGWSTSSTATSGTTGSYTPTGNVKLYATWELAQAKMNIKVGGAWKNGLAFVKINNEWKRVKSVYVKVNGTWKQQS